MHKDPTVLWYRSVAVLSFFDASPSNKHLWDHSSPVMSVGQKYRNPQLENPAVIRSCRLHPFLLHSMPDACKEVEKLTSAREAEFSTGVGNSFLFLGSGHGGLCSMSLINWLPVNTV